SNNNNFPANTLFKSITMSGYILNGNPINLTGNLTDNAVASDRVNLLITRHGGIIKNNASSSRLILTADNTYTGPSTINEGILLVSGNQPSSTIIASGGDLQGFGTVGGVIVTTGKVTPGNAGSTNGELKAVGNVSFTSTATYRPTTLTRTWSTQTARLKV